MSPNTAEGVQKANALRAANRKRAITLTRARKEAEKREPELVAEREQARLQAFWVREEKRRRQRKDARARKAATSAWMSRAA